MGCDGVWDCEEVKKLNITLKKLQTKSFPLFFPKISKKLFQKLTTYPLEQIHELYYYSIYATKKYKIY